MILPDLIRDHGRVKVTNKRYARSRRSYELTELEPGSKEELVSMVTKWFEERGWKTKFLKRTDTYTSRIPKGHTKINWEIGSGHGNVYSRAKLDAKTPNGGWTTIVRRYTSNGDLGALVKRAESISAPTLITKETLPASFVVGTLANFVVDKKHHSSVVQNRWRHIRIVGVVGLKKDGTISVQQVFDPNENPWFHCVINDHSGSVINVITDGDKLHPLNPRIYKGEKKFRVTSNVPSFVRFSTIRDKELLTLAISTFFDSSE